QAKRANFKRARFLAAELTCSLDGLFERRAIDDVEAQQLLLGLGKGTIDDQRLAARPDRGRRRRRHQASNRPKLSLALQLLRHHGALGQNRIVLFFGPAADHRLVVIAEDCVEHAGFPPLSLSQYAVSRQAAEEKPRSRALDELSTQGCRPRSFRPWSKAD